VDQRGGDVGHLPIPILAGTPQKRAPRETWVSVSSPRSVLPSSSVRMNAVVEQGRDHAQPEHRRVRAAPGPSGRARNRRSAAHRERDLEHVLDVVICGIAGVVPGRSRDTSCESRKPGRSAQRCLGYNSRKIRFTSELTAPSRWCSPGKKPSYSLPRRSLARDCVLRLACPGGERGHLTPFPGEGPENVNYLAFATALSRSADQVSE